jgi:hypothetical protein
MAITRLDKPIVVEHERSGYAATWHGGEYIDIFSDRELAENSANGECVEALACRNTTGDDPDTTHDGDYEEYVRDELTAWVRTSSRYY